MIDDDLSINRKYSNESNITGSYFCNPKFFVSRSGIIMLPKPGR